MSEHKKSWVITADKFLTEEQVSQLFEHLKTQRDLAIARGTNVQAIKDFYMVNTLLESGLRVFEFCALNLKDFYGQKLSVVCGKGGKARTVILTKTAMNKLKEWLVVREKLGFSTDLSAPLFPSRYGTQYTTRGVQKRIEIIFDRLGFPEALSTHNTRHTYCSFLLESGKVGLPTVRANMGHSSIATTNLYAHAVSKMDDVDLYSAPSSSFNENDELETKVEKKKLNSSVEAFVRSTNFKEEASKNQKVGMK